MKKYNLSNIMRRAWRLVKFVGATLSVALKAAWKEAKQEFEEKRLRERKDDIYSQLMVNKKDGRARVGLVGRTYPVRNELEAEGFQWNPEKEAWFKIFKNVEAAKQFLYTFNCSKF